MKRRTFLIGGAALAVARPASSQIRGRVPRVGMITLPGPRNPLVAAFREGLRELGHAEGVDLRVEYRSADGAPQRLVSLAAQLVKLKVELIVAGGGVEGARAAMRATHSIPIVFPDSLDAVAEGLVSNPQKPSGNATGLSVFESRVAPGRLHLVRELLPRLRRAAVLFDPAAGRAILAGLQAEADASQLALHAIGGSNPEEIRAGLERATKAGAGALVVLASPSFSAFRQPLLDLVRRQGLVAIFADRTFVEAGGLMSFGADIPGMYRTAARYVLSILQGAKVSELPVEQGKLELVINERTANAERISLPRALVARADALIR